MLVELVNSGKLYIYEIEDDCVDDFGLTSGIVIADNEEEATQKVIAAYMKHGYSSSELGCITIYKAKNRWFADAPDVLEVQ